MNLPVSIFLSRVSLALSIISQELVEAQNALYDSLERGKISEADAVHIQKIDLARQETTELQRVIKVVNVQDGLIELSEAIRNVKLDMTKHLLLTGEPLQTRHAQDENGGRGSWFF